MPILVFRWLTFLLALSFLVYQFGTGDWSRPGGPLRFLTIWALLLSAISGGLMLLRSLRKTDRPHEVIAMTASVFNVMVVYLYWKLFFISPDLVNGDGSVVWHQEYYLHGLGPGLQLFDALLIGQVFQRIWRGVVALMALVPSYVLWTEGFVQRENSHPAGSVTSGLPYPFLNGMEWPVLNGMEWPDRMSFYLL